MSEELKVDNVTTPASGETVEKTEVKEDFKSFSNEEEFKKHEQSVSSTAKNQLLKDFGVSSVEEFKNNQTEFQKFKDSQKTEAERATEQASKSAKDVESLQTKNQNLERQLVASKKGINEKKVNDAVLMANNRVTDNMDFNQALDSVLVDYPDMLPKVENSGIPNTNNPLQESKKNDGLLGKIEDKENVKRWNKFKN